MKKFNVYHPETGQINITCNLDMPFKKVATVVAPDLMSVYPMVQNDFNPEYRKAKVRSTCVGDVIEDIEAGKHYLVRPIGYEEIAPAGKEQEIEIHVTVIAL